MVLLVIEQPWILVLALLLVVAQLPVDEVAQVGGVVGQVILLEQVDEKVERQLDRVVLKFNSKLKGFESNLNRKRSCSSALANFSLVQMVQMFNSVIKNEFTEAQC